MNRRSAQGLASERSLRLRASILRTTLALAALASIGTTQDVKISETAPVGFGFYGEPVPTPDGQNVLYVSNPGLVTELFVHRLDGSGSLSSISGPLPAGSFFPEFEISHDSTRVVYRQRSATLPAELFVASIAAPHVPTRLHPELPPGGNAILFELDPNAPQVLYTANQEVIGRVEIFRAPLDGSATSVKVSGPLQPGYAVRSFRITPDSSRVVYLSTPTFPSSGWEISSVRMDGTGVVSLATGSFFGGDHLEELLTLSPDGTWVAYVTDALVQDRFELFAVPTDGSSAPTKLNGTLVADGDVVYMDAVLGRIAFSPDSSRIVYQADQIVDGRFDLFSVPPDGSSPAVQLNGPNGSSVAFEGTFQISPDNSRVVYIGFEDGSSNFEIFSVPLDGSSSWTRLNDPLNAGDAVYMTFSVGGSFFTPYDDIFHISQDSSRVVYRARYSGVRELYSAPLQGGASPVKLNGALVAGGNVAEYEQGRKLAVSPDGSRVIYIADQDVDDAFEVYSAPVDGSAAAVRLNTPFGLCGLTRSVRIDPTSTRVVFETAQPGMFSSFGELRSAPIDGSGADTVLSDPGLSLNEAGVESDIRVTADGRSALYRGNLSRGDAIELFRAPLSGDGPQERVSTLETFCLPGDVDDYRTSPDGTWATYLADQRSPGTVELFSVPLDGGPSLVLNAPLTPGDDVESHEITLDGTRVHFTVRASSQRSIYAAPIDGSAPAVFLAGPFTLSEESAHQASADGSRLVYLEDLETPGLFELYSRPLDGSGAPVKLNATLTPGGAITPSSIVLDPTGARVVYRADQDLDDVHELFSVPIDGSAAPIKLNPPLSGTLDVRAEAHRITPDGLQVVYASDQNANNVVELFSVPIDASAPSIQVSGPMATGGDAFTSFQLTPDGTHVVYRADQITNNVNELFSAPIDGSQPAVKLNATPTTGGDVVAFEISSDSSWVSFTGDLETNGTFELFAAPLDASAPANKISGAMLAGQVYTNSFEITPDSLRVVYIAEEEEPGRAELYVSPLDGSLPSRKLNGSLVGGGNVTAFAVGVHRVAYHADQEVDGDFEVFSAPLGPRARSLSRKHGPFSGGNTLLVRGEGFTPETTVAFGDVPAAVTWLDATTLSVVVPASTTTPSPAPATPGAGSPKLARNRLPAVSVDVEVSDGVSAHVLARAYTYAEVRHLP